MVQAARLIESDVPESGSSPLSVHTEPAASESFQFQRVEDFFEEGGGYRSWAQLSKVLGHTVPESNQLALEFLNDESQPCLLTLRFPTPTSFRLRFNPGAHSLDVYAMGNSRSIVTDCEHDLASHLAHDTSIDVEDEGEILTVSVRKASSSEVAMKLLIRKDPYALSVYKPAPNGDFILAHSDAESSIYYKKRTCYRNGDEQVEYSVIQAKKMPSSAKYVGFGEKGGFNLVRNGSRLTYFNFDNMRYRQVYNNGPCDVREPLYDSNPFFLEFNADSAPDCVHGIFVDNTSETFFDLGTYNQDREYLFGSLYGDLDYYFFLGCSSENVLRQYYSFVGTTRLKPRYTLGNHQGCYGYETLYDLHDAVNGYRNNGIPLDGLHVDVDIQSNHCTFTMNEDRFPADTFEQLRDRGIKCSTNITPVVSYVNWNYKTYESGNANQMFVGAAQVNHASSNSDPEESYYQGGVYYGGDRGTFGHYPDLGRKDVRQWWGQQYRLLYSRGLEMVWQDMTTPAIPDPKEQQNTWLYAPRFDASWRLPDKITGSYRSFPFEQLVTDNSTTKYNAVRGKRHESLKDKTPVAKIRNLYSYNLHKATYHGLNNLWHVNAFTFTVLGASGLRRDQASSINQALADAGVLTLLNEDNQLYQVAPNLDYDSHDVNLGLPAEYQPHEQEIRDILKQSLVIEGKRANKRNFIVGRGGFTGMHRFAALWTGDNASEWDFLSINISQVLALGLAGQSMSGQDIGGFEPAMGTEERWVDPELFSRWLMAGAFLPWFRNHYSRKGSKEFQEPYKFQDHEWEAPEADRHFYRAVLPISQYYVQLRYRLLQVFYDRLFTNTQNGLPIVKPLFLTDEGDTRLLGDQCGHLNDEFMVGEDILVAPVIEKEESGNWGRRNIYLPSGSRWFSFKNNRQPLSPAVAGGSDFSYDAALSSDPERVPFALPMYVREGAIIPTAEPEQYVGELHSQNRPNPVTVNIYPGVRQRGYTLHQDDGVSRSSAPKGLAARGADPEARSEFRKTLIAHRFSTNKERLIELTWLHNNYAPPEDYLYIAILDDPDYPADPLAEIRLASKNFKLPLNQTLEKLVLGSTEERADALWQSQQSAWYYNPNIGISFAKVFLHPALQDTTAVTGDVHQDTDAGKAPRFVLAVQYK